MIVVTGAAGFIGSNLVAELNARGREDILAVDDLLDGRKFRNLAPLAIADYEDRGRFRERLASGSALRGVERVYHLGACSDTTEWDGRYMLDNNFAYSRELLHACIDARVPLVYASSAAVYGASRVFTEEPRNEQPLNVYGYSKRLFDDYVRARVGTLPMQVVGLRYFNVYGPGEAHKGRMASVVWHLANQLAGGDELRLFGASHGYAAGEQRRDFIHVADAVAITLWFGEHPSVSGIYNVGTGRSRSFNDLAAAVRAWFGRGTVRYIPFPEDLTDAYQAFTEADLRALRAAGCDLECRSLEQGVADYLDACFGAPPGADDGRGGGRGG